MRRRQIAIERESLEAAGIPYTVTPMGDIIAHADNNSYILKYTDVPDSMKNNIESRLKPKNACPNCGRVFNRGLHLHVRACRV